MKIDTGKDGSWTNKNDVISAVQTKQLTLYPEYLPWQTTLLEITKEFDMHTIHCVICTEDYEDKGMFCERAEFDKLGFEMPPCRLVGDFMKIAHVIPPQKLYFFDIPRVMKDDEMCDFFSGIESLKKGRIFDKQFSAKCRRIDRPNIILFTDTEPCFSYLFSDRWKLHTIKGSQLVPYVFIADAAATAESEVAKMHATQTTKKSCENYTIHREGSLSDTSG